AGGAPERRELVLAVRQFVEKEVVPVVQPLDAAGTWPGELVHALGELGVFGALVPQGDGGLGLDLRTYAMLVEELARGSATLAAILVAHAAAAHTIARFGTADQRARVIFGMDRCELLATPPWSGLSGATDEGGGDKLPG